MLVNLKNNAFKATQWLKPGDHPAVRHFPATPPSIHGYTPVEWYGIHTYRDELHETGFGIDNYTKILPGIWIIELLGDIRLYTDDEFKQLFVGRS